jgi:3',5'-cyclic AMP phosphodiesterase CpdA
VRRSPGRARHTFATTVPRSIRWVSTRQRAFGSTRGWAIAAVLAVSGGCVGGPTAQPPAPRSGSTLVATWVDPSGDGRLEAGSGEAVVRRQGLAPASRATTMLARFVQLTDAHVTDEESPARVEMLDRLGPPFTSAFRPQEALTAQVLAAMVETIDAFHPQAVFETGDLIDNDQQNEFALAFSVLRGGMVDPNSGGPGYAGVQAASNPDPLIYRPAVDSPRYPSLLRAAQQRFRSPGLRAPWYPLPGNHDMLVQGNVRATAETDAIATGSRKLLTIDHAAVVAAERHRLDPHVIDSLLRRGLPGHWVGVPSDPQRRELSPEQALAALRRASGHGGQGPLMDSTVELGPDVEAILLDTVDREGGAAGVLRRPQVAWLRDRLRAAGTRWVVVFSSTPLVQTRGGAPALSLLDRDPSIVAAIAGDVHRNSIRPRLTPAGGYWMITTASLIDYPQQSRAFRLMATANGGVVLETWMLNADPRSRLANISRELAYLDYQGGRPRHLAGRPGDRNAALYKRASR